MQQHYYKYLIFAVLFCTVSCQEDEDDGSYNPEKYEKPYENLVDESSPQQVNPAVPAQIPSAFQQTQQVQPFQQVPAYQQPQQIQAFQQPQQIPAFQQLQQSQPVQQLQQVQQPQQIQPFQQSVQAQNPFPQNPFFQRLQQAAVQQPQVASFQQQSQPQQAPLFQPQSFVPQQAQLFQDPAAAIRQPAPVTQALEDGQIVQTATNYRTDDGHQRSESVDSNGNVLGQYSYVDPNGKTITVKYSAGKDGFKVQGDHIPKSPEPQPQFAPQQINDVQSQFNPPQPRYNTAPQQFFQNPSTLTNTAPVQFAQQSREFAQFPQFSQPQTAAVAVPLAFNPDGSYKFQSGFQ